MPISTRTPSFRSLLSLCCLLLIAGLTSGCVVGRSEGAPSAWPAAVAACEPRQFEGAFQDRSHRASSAHPSGPGVSLFGFLGGRGPQLRRPGLRTEIRASASGDSLRVRLLDQNRRPIASLQLQRGTDFEYTDDAFVLLRRSSSAQAESGNLGAGISSQRAVLRSAANGGLLGQESSNSAGLLFFVVPLVTSSERAMYWAREGKIQDSGMKMQTVLRRKS